MSTNIYKSKLIAILLAISLLVSCFSFLPGANADEVTTNEISTDEITYEEALSDLEDYIKDTVTEPAVGSIGGEWAVLGLARNNAEVDEDYYDTYYKKVETEVKTQDAKENSRWSNKVTEVERIILALNAIGKDPSNVAGVNLYDYVWDKAGHFPGLGEKQAVLGGRQGANELIFALISLDSNNATQPTTATMTRDEMISKIVDEYQVETGGFSLMGRSGSMDVDMTAMAIQSLAPYYETNNTAKTAIDEAVADLVANQKDSAGFASWGSVNAESISQVIVALCALGIDPATDERFVKENRSMIDELLTFRNSEDTGFKHTKNGDTNLMASEQAFYALVAYDRFKNDQNRLYDMTDVTSTIVNGIATISIDKLTIDKGYVLEATEVEINKGNSVWDITKKFMDDNNISYGYEFTEQYNSVYVQSIDGDGEFDHGSGSGWMYSVNGIYPNVGASLTFPEDGDVIKWRYTTNLGEDIGGGSAINPPVSSENPIDLEVESIKNFKNGEEAKLSLTVTNQNEETLNPNLIVGLYEMIDSVIEMVTYNYLNIEMQPEKNMQWGAAFGVPEEGDFKIKAFSWDNMENPQSLSNVKEFLMNSKK